MDITNVNGGRDRFVMPMADTNARCLHGHRLECVLFAGGLAWMMGHKKLIPLIIENGIIYRGKASKWENTFVFGIGVARGGVAEQVVSVRDDQDEMYDIFERKCRKAKVSEMLLNGV